MLLVPGPEGEIVGCHGAVPQQGLPWGPQGAQWGSGGSAPPKLLKCGRGPSHPVPPLLSWWLEGGHWWLCLPCPPHHRRSWKRPMPPMSGSTLSSQRCWLTSSRPCSCSNPTTPSLSRPNSLPPLPASSPPGNPLPLAGLPAPHLATFQLMGNKAASATCPGSFTLGKLSHGEVRGMLSFMLTPTSHESEWDPVLLPAVLALT